MYLSYPIVIGGIILGVLLLLYAIKAYIFRKRLQTILHKYGWVSDQTILRLLKMQIEKRDSPASALDPAVLYETQQTTLSTFVHEILHEVKQPLTVILGFLQLMKKKKTDEEELSDIETIEKHVHRILNLVRRFDSFQPEIREETRVIRLMDVLEPLQRIFAPLCERSGIEFEMKVQPNIEASIPVGQFQQVLLNLLINAREALESEPPKGKDAVMRLQVKHFDPILFGFTGVKTQQSCGLTLVVEDNGPGFPKNLKNVLFEPFHTTKKDGAHMGIGLSICKRIIEAHQGKIEISTPRERGTIIRVWWPCSSRHLLSSKKVSE